MEDFRQLNYSANIIMAIWEVRVARTGQEKCIHYFNIKI